VAIVEPRTLSKETFELRTHPDKWPRWLKAAQTENAEIEILDGRVIWWGGTFHDGIWVDGDWLGGGFRDGIWLNGNFMQGVWFQGDWRKGYFGRCIWNDGIFRSGHFEGWWRGGVWRGGEFNGVGHH
jgi:hypothetical protein